VNKQLVYAVILILFCGAMYFNSNFNTRYFGGVMTETLPAGQTFVNATWKEGNLWIVTRERKEGETPQTYQVYESSLYGMFNGKVIVKEQ